MTAFFPRSHNVLEFVAAECVLAEHVCVYTGDILFPQGSPDPFLLSAIANQPSSASIIY